MTNTSRVYCPLTMMHGEPMECVRYDGSGDTCHLCPFDSMDAAARHLNELGDVLNVDADTFGTYPIADAIGCIAEAIAEQ